MSGPDQPNPPSPAETETRILRAIGPYTVERKLGQGGMGTVFEAYDPRLRRKVALKVLSAGGGNPEDVARFLREAEHTAKLRHPNCIQIHEMGRANGCDYFTMDLIEGVTLDKWAAEKKRTPREIASLIEKAARALHHAHENGIIHRDIKPSNVMLDKQGEPIVMDFGLARSVHTSTQLTLSGVILGTPTYMPP